MVDSSCITICERQIRAAWPCCCCCCCTSSDPAASPARSSPPAAGTVMWESSLIADAAAAAPLPFLVVAALAHSPHSPCRVHTTLHRARYQQILSTALDISPQPVPSPERLIDRGQSSPRHARGPGARALSTHPTPTQATDRRNSPRSPLTHSLTRSLLSPPPSQQHNIHDNDTPKKQSSLYPSLTIIARSRQTPTPTPTPHQSIHHPTRLHSALSETASIPACLLHNT